MYRERTFSTGLLSIGADLLPVEVASRLAPSTCANSVGLRTGTWDGMPKEAASGDEIAPLRRSHSVVVYGGGRQASLARTRRESCALNRRGAIT
jgi:hypothetical protein